MVEKICPTISPIVFSELSTFVSYCQMIFKNTVESGIIVGKSRHVILAGSFNLLRLLPNNVIIAATNYYNIIMITIWASS